MSRGVQNLPREKNIRARLFAPAGTKPAALGGESYVFDSFECAIHLLAPMCSHCGCRIVGHGVEVEDEMFCCAHCAKMSGMQGVADRI